jgi:hypothetical protein
MKRLAILDDERLQLKPVNIRLWVGIVLIFILGAVFATAAGTAYIVRRDYLTMNGIINEAVTRNDRLMAICVLANEQTKQKMQQVKKQVPPNIGGDP